MLKKPASSLSSNISGTYAEFAGDARKCQNNTMDEDRNIRREVLPNGLSVITEEMQHIRSVSIGIWVKTGSRDEDKQWNGISHFDEDNPDYLVHEIFTQNFWKDHPLGRPILGTRDTVRRFEKAPVSDFYAQRFSPGNVIITAAGYLKHQNFVDLVKKYFDGMKPVS